MDKLIRCVSIFCFLTLIFNMQIFNPNEALKWDKNLQSSKFIPLEENVRSYGLSYMAHKKQYTFQSRDFVEKGFQFYHEGKFYRFSTKAKNGDDHVPIPKDTVRGETLYNFSIMERDPKTKKIKFTVVTQCDFKMSIPAFMINTFLPKAAKQWKDHIEKHYMKNHKNL